MRTILDEGTIERSDESGNQWIGNWIAWEDEIERKIDIDYCGETGSCSITSAQNFSEGQLQVASMLFDQLLRDLGHYLVRPHGRR
jgi:hypothetical protein